MSRTGTIRNPFGRSALIKFRLAEGSGDSMRAVLLILVIVVLAVIAAFATGLININQVRGGMAPEVSATQNGMTAKGGRAPSFEVETGSVKVGTGQANVAVPKVTLGKENKTVQVPKIELRRAGDQGNQSAQ
jgi:hypothetical protein